MDTEIDYIAEVKNKLFDTAQYLGKDLLIASIKALHSILKCTECSLWTINHNSTLKEKENIEFISTSLICRASNVIYNYPHDTDYVHDLKDGLFKKVINPEESNISYFSFSKEEAISYRHRSRDFVETAKLNRFIIFPIRTPDSNTVNALLEISYQQNNFENSFFEKLSGIIQSFFSAAIYRDSFYQRQQLMDDLINCHRKYKDKEASDLFGAIIRYVLLKAFPAQGASIFIWDNYLNRYNLAATTGLKNEPNHINVFYQIGEGRTGLTGKTGKPLIADDEKNSSMGKYCEILNNKAKTEIFIPIKDPSQPNEVIGIFRLVNKKNVCNEQIIDYFNDNDVALMEDAADYLALIIANYWKEESQYDIIDKLTHEITTPANAIWKTANRLYTHLSEPEFLNRNLSPYLKNIIDFAEIQRWQASTNLFLSRNRRKQPFNVRYSIKSTPLYEVIKDSIDIARPIARKYNVLFSNIYINPESDPKLKINIDKNAFVTMFYNLFTNAIKYHDPKAKDQFYIETSYWTDDNNLMIEVSDNGIGIDSKEQNKVFEKGYRSKSAMIINATGYGIGLTVIRQIVEDFGGKIAITNNRKPTTFQIKLPQIIYNNHGKI